MLSWPFYLLVSCGRGDGQGSFTLNKSFFFFHEKSYLILQRVLLKMVAVHVHVIVNKDFFMSSYEYNYDVKRY